ncbi:hypothetical protein V502_09916, partial [Pseudogymnoascus sp. VKM F-4520 (FW-2644)]
MYSARRASKAKEQPLPPQQQQQQQGNSGKPRRGAKPAAVPFAGRYSASSSPHPDPVAAAASAAAAAAGGVLPNEKLRQDHRNRGLSMPNFRHGGAGGGPQIAATYKIAVDPPPPPPAAAGGPFTPSYPPNAWRSESRGGGANVRWRDLVDIDIPLGGWVKEPLAPDAPPAVG